MNTVQTQPDASQRRAQTSTPYGVIVLSEMQGHAMSEMAATSELGIHDTNPFFDTLLQLVITHSIMKRLCSPSFR